MHTDIPKEFPSMSATEPGSRKHKSQFAKPLGHLLHLIFPMTTYRARLLPSRRNSLNTFSDKYCRERNVIFFLQKGSLSFLKKYKLVARK